jgi:hypothetical protein
MNDDERRRIAEEVHKEADLTNRVKNLEAGMSEMKSGLVWGMRAIWGGVAYLLIQIWTYVSQGGTLK